MHLRVFVEIFIQIKQNSVYTAKIVRKKTRAFPFGLLKRH